MHVRPNVSPRKFGSEVFWFLLHTLAALPVGGITAVLLVGAIASFLPSRYQNDLLNWCPIFVIGLAFGFVANRKSLKNVACWVWLSGVAWLALGIWTSMRSYDPRYYQGCSATENVVNAFFVLNGHKCGGGSSTLAGVFFTIPAFDCIAYSVGAWAALRVARRKVVLSDASSRSTLGIRG